VVLPSAGSSLLALVFGLGVVARSYVDGPKSPDTSRKSHTNHGLVWLRLLSVHQRDAHNPLGRDTCSSVDSHSCTVNTEWTNDVTLRLISEYEKHVVLWEEISKERGISVVEVKKKMNNGRN
jgi:hypothetical protein